MTQAGVKPVKSEGTVGKALEILDQIAEFERPVRFSEILDISPHPKATLYRFMQNLTQLGMLSFDKERQTYAPGLRLVRLAHAAWRQSSLAPIARPHLDKLSQAMGETIHLAQLDRGQVLYVDKRNAKRPVEMFSQAGKIGPGYCTGVGKAMIAFLPEAEQQDAIDRQAFFAHTPNTFTNAESFRAELARIRAEGVAFDREEHERGINCIAAPIRAPEGRVLGAISITTSDQHKSLEELEGYKDSVLNTANDIAIAAQDWQFPG